MKKPLNVCLMNDSFPPTIDGVANTVFNYANIIHDNFGDVVVATPEYPDVVDNYPFEVLRYPSINTTKFVGYRCGVPFNLGALSELNNRDIDIIHSHCPVSSTFLARMVRDSIQKPVIFTYHTKFDIDIKHASDSKLVQNAAIKALVRNVEACDDVWVVSNGAGENLRSLGFSKDYIVMPNGVDFEKGKSSDEEIEAIRSEYHLNPSIPTYLFVGRMMWYKGIRIILDALAEKMKYQQDFRMVFVGDGMDCPDMKDYCHQLGLDDKCIFAGMIKDRKKLKAFFSTCDIFLFPSTFDTNGIVVREAAAAGLGTILIKGSCAAEDTIDGQNVIQIEENAESLAKVLIEANDNLEFFHRIGRNAQNELYMSWYDSVSHAYDRYVEVSERYIYDRKQLVQDNSMEAFLATFSDISVGLDKAKESRMAISNRIEEVSNNILDSIDKGTDKVFNSLEDTAESIKSTIEETTQAVKEATKDATIEAAGVLGDIIVEAAILRDKSIQKIKEFDEEQKKIREDFDRYL